jgi:hypothetical protein
MSMGRGTFARHHSDIGTTIPRPTHGQCRQGTNAMNAIGAYIITRSKEAGWKQESGYPDSDPLDGAPAPKPGLGARVRKLFRPRGRVASEPGFAASTNGGGLADFVPRLQAYPYQQIYR